LSAVQPTRSAVMAPKAISFLDMNPPGLKSLRSLQGVVRLVVAHGSAEPTRSEKV
jgi:hypothetical protein